MDNFVSRGLDISANQTLIAKIARQYPTGLNLSAIARCAKKSGIPVEILAGIYAIEKSFRPWWVRWVENAYLYIMLLLWVFTGMPFRNLTIGVFQVGCHRAAEFIGAKYKRVGNKVTIERNFCSLFTLLALPVFNKNLVIATYHILSIWNQAVEAGYDLNSSVVYLGKHYNGKVSYGIALNDLILYVL